MGTALCWAYTVAQAPHLAPSMILLSVNGAGDLPSSSGLSAGQVGSSAVAAEHRLRPR